MATYSGLWDGVYNTPYPIATRVASRAVTRSGVNVLFHGKRGRRARKLIITLLGAAAGAAATQTQTRVATDDGISQTHSGKVAITTETLVNRVTTAADVAALTADFTKSPRPTSYPKDLSGNGGAALGY